METVFQKIKAKCLEAVATDPIVLVMEIMDNDYINIHGPEHHVLDGACFLTAMHNAGVEFDLENALDEMIERGKTMPGATCGRWGMCGSAASVGAALAVLHGTGPLSDNDFYKDNLKLVSAALSRIGEVGGPRCCKRNAFLSLQTAVDFVEQVYGIKLGRGQVECHYCAKNKQCIGCRCPFFPG